MKPSHVNRLRLTPSMMVTHRGLAVLSAGHDGLITGAAHGYYLHQTRFLSRFELLGEGLKAVSANATAPHATLAYLLMPSPTGKRAGPPGATETDGGEVVLKGIEVRVNTYVGGGLHCDITVTNRTLAPAEVSLDLAVEADFADMDEVSAGERRQNAAVERRWHRDRTLELAYGQPQLGHATRIEFEGEGDVSDEGDRLALRFTLDPQRPQRLGIDVVPVFRGEAHRPWYGRDGVCRNAAADAAAEAWAAQCTTLACTVPMVQNAWDRASDDLASLQMLEGEGPERWVPIAGVPKYSALFGRDTLVTGLQSMLLSPATLEGSLRRVGRWTADKRDDPFDAEPGKVLHQHQLSPLALLGLNPFLHYYGDYSAPGLFVLGAALHFARTADGEAFAAVRPNVEATLAWMDRDGDADRDGFYEYETRAGANGIKNQGWKDSGQAILYPDGALVQNPIAVVEVQGLFYAAKQALALVYRCLGEEGRAEDLLGQAAALKARFNRSFWLPDIGYYALALDPDKRPVATRASDPGACLAYGIVDDDKAASVARHLMGPDLFSGWGVRTLSADHPAFNPLAYHLGTVWPMSNATIGQGLRRYGFVDEAQRLTLAQFEATQLFDFDRLPEVFGGHARDALHPHPGIYPDACSPQAWSASAVILGVQSLLGLTPLAPIDTLIVDPILPDWLPRLTLRDFAVGRHRVTLAFHRDSNGASHCDVVSGGAGLRLHRPPAPEPGAPAHDRLAATLRSLEI